MIHLQKCRQSRKTQKSGSRVRRVSCKTEQGRKRVKNKCLCYIVEEVLARRNKAEQRKRPKFPCDPTGLFVAGKHQAVQSSENRTT